jgi:hypothetical protein
MSDDIRTPAEPEEPLTDGVPDDADPVEAAPVEIAPVETSSVETTSVETTSVETTDAEPIAPTTDPGDAPIEAASEASVVATESAPVQTVYIHAPIPPKKRSNRGIGALIALLSAILFAAVYAAVALVVVPLILPQGSSFSFADFLGNPFFYVPIAAYAVGFILLVLIVNRANWWAYVLGSFVVAFFVYFVSVGVLLLVGGVISLTPAEAAVALRLTAGSPLVIISAIVSREVTVWVGAAIASRGRRLKVRNAEEKAAFERETADKRAEYERAVAAV